MPAVGVLQECRPEGLGLLQARGRPPPRPYKDSLLNAEVPAIIQAYLDESVTLDQQMENLAKLIESMDKDVI